MKFILKGTMNEKEIDEENNLIIVGIVWAFITILVLAYSFAIHGLVWAFIIAEYSIIPLIATFGKISKQD